MEQPINNEFSVDKEQPQNLKSMLFNFVPPVIEKDSKYEKERLLSMQAAVDPAGYNPYQTAKEIRQAMADTKKANDQLSLMTSLESQPALTQDEGEVVADVATSIDAGRSDAAEQYFVDEMSMLDRASSEREADIAQEMYFANQIARIGEDSEWMESANNWLGLIVIPDESIDITRALTGDVTENLDVMWNSAEMWESFIDDFHSMSREDQRIIFKGMEKALMEATDSNEVKVRIRLAEMLDPTADHTAFHAIDKAALADLSAAGATAGLSLLAAPALLGVAGIFKMVRTLRTAGTIKKLEEMNQIDKAGAGAAVAIRDTTGETARALGIDTPIINAVPFGFNSSIDTAHLTHETQIFLQASDTLPTQVGELVAKPAVTAIDIQAFVGAKVENLNKLGSVDNIRWSKSDKEGITVSYDQVNDYGFWIAKEDKFPINADMVTTGFKTESIGETATFLGTPSIKFAADKLTTVIPATRALFAQGVTKALFGQALKDVYKPLGSIFSRKSRVERKKLDQILQKGDDYIGADGVSGKVFSYDELVTRGVDGVKLSENGYQSYVRMRKLMDVAYEVKNTEVRANMVSQGVKQVLVNNKPLTGKVFDEAAHAAVPRGSSSILDLATNKLINPTSAELTELYATQNVRLVKLQEAHLYAEGEYATWVLSEGSQVSKLPAYVLHKKLGYIPRETKNGWYYVRENKFGSVNGTKVGPDGKAINVGHSTLKVFDSKNAADAYKLELAQADLARITGAADFAGLSIAAKASRVDPHLRKYEVLYDREMSEEALVQSGIGFSGGMYTGARKEGGLRGANDMVAERISSYDSVQNLIENLSHTYPIQEVRRTLQQKWIQTAKEIGNLDRRFGDDFFNGMSNVRKDRTSDEYKVLQELHDYITSMVRVPTNAERQIENMTRKLAVTAEFGKEMSNPLSRFIHNLDHRDPTAVMKGLTFHALLGGGNISQTVVQGMGAAITMSIDPKSVAGAWKMATELGIFDQIANVHLRQAYLLQRAGDKAVDTEALRAWEMSGLKSDLYTTADFGASITRNSMVSTALKSGLELGTLPFRMGELFHRRYTMASAIEWYRREHKLEKSHRFTDADMDIIMTRQIETSLNMSRANKAWFQKTPGVSLATQFSQISFKYAENLLQAFGTNKNITITQKEIRQMAGLQAVAFGLHGIPFAAGSAKYMAGMMGLTADDMTPEQARFVEEGVVGGLMDIWGVNNNLVTRFSVADGVTDLATNAVAGEGSLIDMMGASATPTKRIGEAMHSWYQLWGKSWHHGDVSVVDIQNVLRKNASVFSSVTNAYKAMDLVSPGGSFNSKGYTVKSESENRVNIQTFVAQFYGFSEKSVGEMWDLREALNERDDIIQSAAEITAHFFRSNQLGSHDTEAQKYKAWMLANADFSDEERVRYVKKVEDILGADSQLRNLRKRVEQVMLRGGTPPLNPLGAEIQQEIRGQ